MVIGGNQQGLLVNHVLLANGIVITAVCVIPVVAFVWQFRDGRYAAGLHMLALFLMFISPIPLMWLVDSGVPADQISSGDGAVLLPLLQVLFVVLPLYLFVLLIFIVVFLKNRLWAREINQC